MAALEGHRLFVGAGMCGGGCERALLASFSFSLSFSSNTSPGCLSVPLSPEEIVEGVAGSATSTVYSCILWLHSVSLEEMARMAEKEFPNFLQFAIIQTIDLLIYECLM